MRLRILPIYTGRPSDPSHYLILDQLGADYPAEIIDRDVARLRDLVKVPCLLFAGSVDLDLDDETEGPEPERSPLNRCNQYRPGTEPGHGFRDRCHRAHAHPEPWHETTGGTQWRDQPNPGDGGGMATDHRCPARPDGYPDDGPLGTDVGRCQHWQGHPGPHRASAGRRWSDDDASDPPL